MPVHDDYHRQRWSRYFTENFRRSHLRPHVPLPVGGHDEGRRRARLANVAHNVRAQQGRPAYLNSLVFDFEPTGRVRQVFQLMQEVEGRNEQGFFLERGRGPHPTEHEYLIVTTEPGSRNAMARARFLYCVLRLEDGRHLIQHYAGLTDN